MPWLTLTSGCETQPGRSNCGRPTTPATICILRRQGIALWRRPFPSRISRRDRCVHFPEVAMKPPFTSPAAAGVLLALAGALCGALPGGRLYGQARATSPAGLPKPVTFTAEQDHQNMMDQLGIKALRPGPSGNEKAPNHANYDESKANPYANVPDPLTMNDGRKVTTSDMWWKERRPEIVEGLEKYVYGRLPKD